MMLITGKLTNGPQPTTLFTTAMTNFRDTIGCRSVFFDEHIASVSLKASLLTVSLHCIG